MDKMIIVYIDKSQARTVNKNKSECILAKSKTVQEQPYLDLVISSVQHKIVLNGTEVQFSKYEFNVLEYLAQQPGRVFTKDQILQIAGSEDPQDEDNAVWCLIAGIRKKLRKYTNKEYIQTVRGVGYRFVIPEE